MSLQISGQVQKGVFPNVASGTSSQPLTQGAFGDALVSELNARYTNLVLAGQVYSLFTTAASPSAAFPFAAAGTPLLAVINPAGSGKNLVLLAASLGVKTTGTAAVSYTGGLSLAGVSAIGTGTTTVPTNLLSYQKAGSVATGFVNTALTANTLSTAVMTISLLSGGLTAATAVTNVVSAFFETAGLVVVAPGNLLALGISTAPTAGAFDANLIWAELPQ